MLAKFLSLCFCWFNPWLNHLTHLVRFALFSFQRSNLIAVAVLTTS
ncbi:hypothetical protein NY10_1721 [Carnobacterium antarcticum]|nr:hypothetical protein NY10_1721 [Carnobacterium sp. CP1]